MIKNTLMESSESMAVMRTPFGLARSIVISGQIFVLSTTRKLPVVRITKFKTAIFDSEHCTVLLVISITHVNINDTGKAEQKKVYVEFPAPIMLYFKNEQSNLENVLC